MYKVGFVDDEIHNFELLVKLVDWEDKGFEIIWTATDGNEAIYQYEKEKPDLMLVDIRMPMMDGLELVQRIREEDHHVQLVLISAFHEFSYAQRAIRFGVQDYLLKPVSRMVLNQMVDTIRKRLDAKPEEAGDSHMQKRLETERAVLEILRKLKHSEQDSGKQEIGSRQEVDAEQEAGKVYFIHLYEPNGRLQQSDAMQLLQFTESFMEQNQRTLRFFVKDGNWNYWIGTEETCTREFFKQYRRQVKERYGISADIHIAETAAGREQTGRTIYDQIHQLYGRRMEGFYAEEGSTYNPDFHEAAGQEQDFVMHDKALKESLQQGEPQLLLAWVHSYYQAAKEKRLNPYVVKNDLLDLLVQLKVKIKQYYVQETFYILRNISVEQFMQEEKACVLLFYVEQIIQKVFADLKQQMENSDRRYQVVIKGNSYVEEHFGEEQFSVAAVADYVGLSKNYFVTLYKEMTGKGFWDYVTDLRMERAKELLRTTDLPIGAVGRAIGYESEFHFSRKFKEQEGVSPKDYRNQISH